MRPVALLLVAGCVACPPGVPMPSDSIYLGVAGLYTFPSDTTKVPKGALALAEDVVIDKEGLLEPRPGFPPFTAAFPFGTGANRARKLYWYNGFLLALVDTSPPTLAYYDGAAWHSYSGTFNYPDSGFVRCPSFEANGNFYLSTASGLQVLDTVASTAGFIPAGPPKALDVQVASANVNGGFLAANAQVAYRVAWGIRDANNNVKLGAVSQRATFSSPAGLTYTPGKLSKSGSAVVTATSPSAHGFVVGQFVTVGLGGVEANFSGGTFAVASVPDATHFTYNDGGLVATGTNTQVDTITATNNNAKVTTRIPSGITTSHFLQVYRTAQTVAASVDPGDVQQQVYEYLIRASDITAGTIAITDISDDNIRGAALYTNQAQEGIAASNERPPVAYDVMSFKDTAFYLRTKSVQRMILQVLGVSTWGGGGDNFAFWNAAGYETLAGLLFTLTPTVVEDNAGSFIVFTSGTPAQNVANTVQSMVKAINNYAGNSSISAYYASGADDPPGKIVLEGRSMSTPQFLMSDISRLAPIASSFSPTLPLSMQVSGLTRAASTVTVSLTSAVTGQLSVGQTFDLHLFSGVIEPAFPAGTKTVASIIDTGHFTYTEAGAAGSSSSSYMVAPTVSSTAVSSLSEAANGVAWSKLRQPESVPLGNADRIGGATKNILRGAALRNSAFIFKEDGLWRLTGDYPTWNFQLFDPTVKLLLPESVRTLGNYVYALTDQGVAKISDTGVEIVSRPIENLLPKNIDNTNLTPYGFAVTRESRHEYILFFNPSGGSPTIGLRYNSFTNTWTRWNLSRTAAVVDPVNDFLYLADGSANDVTRDTRAGTFLDYYDGTVTGFTITSQNLALKTATVSSVTGMSVGDTLFDGVHYSVIAGIVGNVLTLTDAFTWATSGLTVYNAINSVWQWTPQTAGDPNNFKHWRDAVADFKQAAFASMVASFSSELATTPSSITLAGTSGITAAGISQTVRTWCTPEAARSSQLSVKLAVRNALAAWQLRGLELDYRMTRGGSR